MPIKVFLNKLIAGSPSTIKVEDRKELSNYHWPLQDVNDLNTNLKTSQGKVIVLNYWATWCPPCVAEMPSLQNLYDEFGEEVDFYFVTSEEKEIVQKFLQKKGFDLPVYFQRFQEPDAIEANALPTTFLISKTGEIVIRETGAASWDSEEIKTEVRKLLQQ